MRAACSASAVPQAPPPSTDTRVRSEHSAPTAAAGVVAMLPLARP